MISCINGISFPLKNMIIENRKLNKTTAFISFLLFLFINTSGKYNIADECINIATIFQLRYFRLEYLES